MLGDEDDARLHFADGVAYSERLGAPRWRERCAASGEHLREQGIERSPA
jgi:hypothetical protein